MPHPPRPSPRRIGCALAILVGLCGSLASEEHPEPPPIGSKATGAHYRILCHFHDDAIAKAALETAEAAWPVASRLLPGAVETLEQPVNIHLYRSRADYLAAEWRLSQGRFAENGGYSNHDSRAAYITLEPDCSDEVLQRVGLTAQTRRMIAHEAAHLVVYWSWKNYRHLPEWLAEGMAIWVADEVLIARRWSQGLVKAPLSSKRVLRCREMLTAGTLPSAQDIFDERLGDLGADARYAVWGMFFRFLQSEAFAPGLRRVLEGVEPLARGRDLSKRVAAVVGETWDEKQLEALDEGFRSFVEGLEPRWDEVSRSVTIRGKRWFQIAFPNSNAILWTRRELGKRGYEVGGYLELLPSNNPRMNVLLGRSGDGYVVVAFEPGTARGPGPRGSVAVYRFDAAEDEWDRLAIEEADVLELNKRTRFDIAVNAGVLRARLNGKPSLEVDLAGHPMHGAWGVGVEAGGAGVWDSVQAK